MSKIVPVLGSVGVYSLKPPFDVLTSPDERYTCMSIRKISECLANNIDVAVDFYTLPNGNGTPDASYQGDLDADVEIIGLMNRKGHWVYVPSTAILAYPNPNGIVYHSVSFIVTTKAIPVDLDLTSVKTELQNTVTDTLGIPSSVKVVEATKPSQVDSDVHIVLNANRVSNIQSHNNDRARIRALQQREAALIAKVAELEAYIINNSL